MNIVLTKVHTITWELCCSGYLHCSVDCRPCFHRTVLFGQWDSTVEADALNSVVTSATEFGNL